VFRERLCQGLAWSIVTVLSLSPVTGLSLPEVILLYSSYPVPLSRLELSLT